MWGRSTAEDSADTILPGGFGGFSNQFDTDGVDVLANGTVNPWVINLFGFQAHHEMATLGKQLTRNFYGMDGSSSSDPIDDSDVNYAPSYDKSNSTGTRLYSYYQACSEGGREGWSQLQRYGDQFDGAVVGAPAFRFAHQQVNHMFSAVAEQTIGYVPPPCEFDAIVNATIAFCDPLDGRTDGVISRSDLCLLKFDMKSIIGKSYYCAAQAANPNAHGPGGGALPEQSGKVTAKGVEVAQTIINGLKDSQGNQAYLSWAIGASFADATPSTLNNATGLWELPSVGIAATWIGRELLKLQVTDLATTGVTYDHLVDWMYYGWQTYFATLQTTWPDLTPLKNAGGKVIHYHGEADNSVPVGSSVHYYENVASTMYPNKSYKDAHAALGDWYRLYLIPGAAHCNTNTLMPNGPWPVDMLAQMIQWVEKGTVPTTLNATVTSGPYQGSQPICAWPLRPRWTSKTKMVCEYDQQSLNTWQYKFPAFKLPVW